MRDLKEAPRLVALPNPDQDGTILRVMTDWTSRRVLTPPGSRHPKPKTQTSRQTRSVHLLTRLNENGHTALHITHDEMQPEGEARLTIDTMSN